MKFKSLIAAILLFCTLVGCQKEADLTDPSPATTNCRPVKIWAYDGANNPEDSARYEYTNDRLSKIRYNDTEELRFEYSGDRITKRIYQTVGSQQPEGYDQLTYNTDGTLAKIETYFDAGFGVVKLDSAVFAYANGKLSSVSYYALSISQPATQLLLEAVYEYQYTGNNVTKLVEKDYTSGNPSGEESYLFAYDSNPNYFLRQSSQFALTDPYFIEEDEFAFVFAQSQNNVVRITTASDPTDTTSFSYAADDKGNVTEIRADGDLALRYAYECR